MSLNWAGRRGGAVAAGRSKPVGLFGTVVP